MCGCGCQLDATSGHHAAAGLSCPSPLFLSSLQTPPPPSALGLQEGFLFVFAVCLLAFCLCVDFIFFIFFFPSEVDL